MVDLKVAPDGSLYYITYYPGALYRVSYDTTSHLPVASASADVTKGVEPLTVHFSSAGSSDPDGDPLSYHWDLGDGTTSTEPNPTKTYADKGVYTVAPHRVGGRDRPGPADRGPGRAAARADVAAPAEGQLYRAGDTITYNAFGPTRPASTSATATSRPTVRLHHGTHVHPFVGPLTGRAGSFTIPTTGEASADTWFEVTVTATDRNGLSSARSVNIFPRKSVMTPRDLAVRPRRVPRRVPVGTPRTVAGVEGFQRELAAPLYGGGRRTAPSSSSPAGRTASASAITTPPADTTYTATTRASEPFIGEYYDNTTFSGPPVLTRQDPDVDFVWWSSSPGPGGARRPLLGPLDQDAALRCRSVHASRPWPTTASGCTSTTSG